MRPAAVCALLWTQVALAAFVPCSITGVRSGAWSNASIWFARSPPGPGLAVNIASTQTVTVSASQTSGTLEIGRGAILLVASGVTLSVSGRAQKGTCEIHQRI